MTPTKHADLKYHLQTAIEIELATIPVYLYTYYSINRSASNCDKNHTPERANELETFANKAGGMIMSVAVEEMLHLSLACNILKALGGEPKIYQKSPYPFPHTLPHHAGDFTVGTERLSKEQLAKFLVIEKPEKKDAPPEGNNWETIGQFYDYISQQIEHHTENSDFQNEENQLKKGEGYYASNNVDTIYPTNANWVTKPKDPNDPSALGAKEANYPNNNNSGNLVTVKDKASALAAIEEIKHQGEGYPDDPTHQYDDPDKNEDSHWFKFHELYQQIQTFSVEEQKCFLLNVPSNPQVSDYSEKYQPIVNLANAVFSYLLWITEISFTLEKEAQHTMFYIGMHKGMIFILDKIIGSMRYLTDESTGYAVMPTFENYVFTSRESAKEELVDLAKSVPSDLNLGAQIIERITNLPSLVLSEEGIVQFS